MNRRSVAGLVLLSWGGAIGWLAARELARPGRPVLSDERTISPSAAFYVVSSADRQLGFASTTVDTVPTGLVVDDRLVLEIPAGDTIIRSDVRTLANLSNTMRLRDFTASVGAPAGRFEVQGQIQGDTALSVTVVTEGNAHEFELPLPGPVVLANHLSVHLSSTNQLITGSTVELALLDPVALTLDSARITITGDSVFFVPDSAAYDSSTGQWVEARVDTVRAWRVEQLDARGRTESWIDGLGRLVFSQNPSGPRRERTAFEIAFNNFRARDRSAGSRTNVVLASAIAAHAGSPPGLQMLSVSIEGLDLTGLGADLRQRYDGKTVTVRREPDSAMETAGRLPFRAAEHATHVASRVPYAYDPFVQAQARQVVDGSRNPRTAARRIVEWISTELAKEIVPAVPAPAEILSVRRGDVWDHATLFVSMSRGVGIPTRPVAGMLYIDGTLYLHAWAEVFLGKSWVAIDPTFGRFPAGAEYIRLASGSGTLPAQVMRMGQLKVDVLEASQ